MHLEARLVTISSLLVLSGCVEPITFPEQPRTDTPERVVTPIDDGLRTPDVPPAIAPTEDAIFIPYGLREVPARTTPRLQSSTSFVMIHGTHARPLIGSLERVSAVGIRADTPGLCLMEMEFEVEAIEVLDGEDIVSVEVNPGRRSFDVTSHGLGSAHIVVSATLAALHPLETTTTEHAEAQAECMAYFDVNADWKLDFDAEIDVRDVASVEMTLPPECSTQSSRVADVHLLTGTTKDLFFRLMDSSGVDVTWTVNGPETIDFDVAPSRRVPGSHVTVSPGRFSVTVSTANVPGIDVLRSELGDEVVIETFAEELVEEFEVGFLHPIRGYLDLSEGQRVWSWSGSAERDAPHVIAAVSRVSIEDDLNVCPTPLGIRLVSETPDVCVTRSFDPELAGAYTDGVLSTGVDPIAEGMCRIRIEAPEGYQGRDPVRSFSFEVSAS